MMIGLVHKADLAPYTAIRSPGDTLVRYSAQALAAAEDDRYGDLRKHLATSIDLNTAEIVEVEIFEGVIINRVVCVPATAELELVMIIQANGLVSTVWGNLIDDKHKTLSKNLGIKHLASVKWNALTQLLKN